MKEITIKRNSWHFWIATNLGFHSIYRENDFCKYLRNVLLGLFLLCFYLFAFLMYLWSGYDWFVWATSVLFHGAHTGMPKFSVLFVFISSSVLTLSVIIGAAWCVEKIAEWLNDLAYVRRQLRSQQLINTVEPKEPSFLQTAYRSLKDKVCFKMNIMD